MRHFLVVGAVLTAITSWPGAEARAACADVTLERAQLTRAISDREPAAPAVQRITADDYVLYAFTEIRGAKGRTITHIWFHENQEAAVVALAIGADRWRTWSSKRLGFRRDNNWRVEVRLDDGCLLATLVAGGDGDFSETATRISTLLDSGDVTGARLALGEAREQALLPDSILERLTHRDVPLAQARALLEEGNLYIARARLRPLLERWPGDSDIEALRADLDAALNVRKAMATGRIRLLQRVLRKLPAGAGVCETAAPAWWQPMLDAWQLEVLERHVEDQQLQMLLLDSRSGATLSLVAPCLETAQ